MKPQKINTLGMEITTGKYQDQIEMMLDKARKKESAYICVANVHMLVETNISSDFQKTVNNSFMTVPDGKPLTWAIKLLHKKIKQDRVCGMDLFPDLLKEAEQEKLSVYFYGGKQITLDKIAEKIEKDHPNLIVKGYNSPPFRNLSDTEKLESIAEINSLSPDIIFVSLGCPKQEKWMAEMQDKIHSLMIGIGGAFPVFAGKVKRAPVWMQNNGLEWFYRFCQEPRRMWKRYLKTNTLFIYYVIKEIFKNKD